MSEEVLQQQKEKLEREKERILSKITRLEYNEDRYESMLEQYKVSNFLFRWRIIALLKKFKSSHYAYPGSDRTYSML